MEYVVRRVSIFFDVYFPAPIMGVNWYIKKATSKREYVVLSVCVCLLLQNLFVCIYYKAVRVLLFAHCTYKAGNNLQVRSMLAFYLILVAIFSLSRIIVGIKAGNVQIRVCCPAWRCRGYLNEYQ